MDPPAATDGEEKVEDDDDSDGSSSRGSKHRQRRGRRLRREEDDDESDDDDYEFADTIEAALGYDGQSQAGTCCDTQLSLSQRQATKVCSILQPCRRRYLTQERRKTRLP